MCEKLGCLPRPGGLFDQDPMHVRRLEKIYEAQARYEQMELEKVRNKNK